MRVWAVSEASAGTLNQAVGLAEELAIDPEVKIIRREHRLRRRLFPFKQDIRQAEPDVIISCGRVSEQFVGTMKRAYQNRPFAVHLQPPAPENDFYEMVFVSGQNWEKDFDARPNFHAMTGVPNRIRTSRLSGQRALALAKWVRPGEKVAALLIGGPNKAFSFNLEVIDNLISAARSLLADDWRILATMSRRTPGEVAEKLRAIEDKKFTLWNFEGENPYLEYLAAADAFLITLDSITMISEAAVSGKPIYILPLAVEDSTRAEKFLRFQQEMQNLGIARAFSGAAESFGYAPLQETEKIADLVRTEFLADRIRRKLIHMPS